MKFAVLLLFAASALQFEITDARGKKASGVTMETSAADADAWYTIRAVKTKAEPVIVWPFDAKAKEPDGPAPIPAIVIVRGDQKALATPGVVAAIATPVVLGISSMDEMATRTGLDAAGLAKAISALVSAQDPFAKGVGLLNAKKAAEAADELGRALKERQRQLTRVPSEIYPAAMLYGNALLQANKFDDAAVAFQTAMRLRPSDSRARMLRAEALRKAGKQEAAEELLNQQ
jgi:tetratricopeptide (TPR) repeat protein